MDVLTGLLWVGVLVLGASAILGLALLGAWLDEKTGGWGVAIVMGFVMLTTVFVVGALYGGAYP